MSETPYNSMSLTQKILDRQDQYEAIRAPRDERCSEIIELTQPGYTEWESHVHGSGSVWTYDNGVQGRFRGTKIYEGTPAWGLRVMADGWLGSMVSEVIPWFKYLFPEPDLRDNDEVNSWMEKLETAMYGVYRKSQLYEALSPFALGAFSVGSPVILPYDDPKEGRISCEVPHPKENYFGPYDSYHRKYSISALDAVMKFMGGKVPADTNDAKLSRSLLDNWKGGRHAIKHEFIRAIYRRDDPILAGLAPRFRNKPWMQFYIETPGSGASDEQLKKEPVLVEGYFTKPHIRWDWEKNTDEYYARTPSWHAINDIRSLQEFERQKMSVGQQNLNPPTWLKKKFRNQFTGYPGNKVYYDTDAEAGNPPVPINQGTNWQIGDEQSKQIRRSVERWYNTSFFLQLSELTATNTGSWPSATQILQLSGEKAAVLSPRVGPFSNVMRQIDTRIFDIELRKGIHGALPPAPPIIEDYLAEQAAMGKESVDLTVEMIGPMAQLQQRAETLGRSEQGLAIIERYATLDPLMLKKVDLAIAMERDLEQIRWPQDAIVSKDEYEEVLANIAQQEAEDRQAAMAIESAKAAKGVSGPVDESSIIAKIGQVAA